MTDQTRLRASFVRHGIRLLVLAAAVGAFASCNDLARAGKSPSYLIIDTLVAASGAEPGEFGSQLMSDVQTLVNQQVNGQTVRVPTIFNDLGQATIRLALKNAGTAANPTAPSIVNSVTITRFRVVFKRADGRNEPGRDVPYAFDGALTVTITGATASQIGFDIVRHNNKEEPPLRNLIGFGGSVQINSIADITFYGRDQAGNEVSVTGTISVNFADFGDPT